ncbi:DUF5662 family protein [Clostridium botulinum]|uniref:DUF5662 family protein n=1 Tax=Clostridium botulinum TaxID=1491 RepID=UPI00090BA583|nr:DUF5662 family protein [Clostridium botulinum]APH20811.1 hypothetical protein NPD1_4237 [Clostridium botulinum]APQ71273.1 hypothetical protein RSJ8_4194 [Clostridium botulinum]
MIKINIYIKYFKYVCEHKKNVFKECVKMSKRYKGKNKRDLIIHAFTHDLSKFNPKEFIPYARYFYGNYPSDAVLFNVPCIQNKDKIKTKENVKKDFNKAWQHHKDRNKHHWNYWHERKLEMPLRYIIEMICDWSAMSIKFGDTPQDFYCKNYDKIKLKHNSRVNLEFELGLLGEAVVFNMTWKELCESQGKTIKEDLKSLFKKESD